MYEDFASNNYLEMARRAVEVSKTREDEGPIEMDLTHACEYFVQATMSPSETWEAKDYLAFSQLLDGPRKTLLKSLYKFKAISSCFSRGDDLLGSEKADLAAYWNELDEAFYSARLGLLGSSFLRFAEEERGDLYSILPSEIQYHLAFNALGDRKHVARLGAREVAGAATVGRQVFFL